VRRRHKEYDFDNCKTVKHKSPQMISR